MLFLGAILFSRGASGAILNWTKSSLDLFGNRIGVAVSPAGDFFASDGFAIERSSDQGRTFREVTGFGAFAGGAIVIDPQNQNIMYAGGGRGLIKSVDGGTNWFELDDMSSRPGTNGIAINPQNSLVVYAGMPSGWGLFKSANGGATWTNPLKSIDVTAVTIDSINPETVYVATSAYLSQPGGIRKSVDGGTSWSTVFTNPRVNSLLVDPDDSQRVYAGTEENGIFRTLDGGATWTNISGGAIVAPVSTIVANPDNASQLFASTGGQGVFFSPDRGTSWSLANDGLTDLNVAAMAIQHDSPHQVFLATEGGSGFWATPAFPPGAPPTWNVDADGNWTQAGNWTFGATNAVGAEVVFGGVITVPRSVFTNEPVTAGRIRFDSPRAYTITGLNPITFDNVNGAARIDVVSGAHTIAAPVILADDTVVNIAPAASRLSITGTISASGRTVTKVGAGVLALNHIRSAMLAIDGGTVSITSNGTAAGTSVVSALSIAGDARPSAKLDLANNAAIVNYTGLSPATIVRQQILAGRGGAGLGKTWNGLGITSSAAAAAPIETRSVGYAENSAMPLGPYSNFRGQAVDNTSVLVAYTRTGDANLDGIVNDDDVTILGASYAPGVPNPSWAFGDFDYNGFVDDDDVTLLGAFYDPSAPPLIVSANEGASSVTAAVPEPRSVVLLLIGTAALSARLLRRKLCFVSVLFAVALFYVPAQASMLSVFFDNFDGGRVTAPGVSANLSGITTLQGVQGYAGLGTASNAFSGNMLRNVSGMAFPFGGVPASPPVPTRLTLTGLPPHNAVELNFLFAVIDSWDGSTGGAIFGADSDVFNVTIDGVRVFSETFHREDLNDQSYLPPTGGRLTSGTQRGFETQYLDAAYNLGLESRFDSIPHASNAMTIEWLANGDGWTANYFEDESWGMDNVEVVLHGVVPEPQSVTLALAALVMLGACSSPTFRWASRRVL
jgi:hypothetical protein